LNQLIEPAASAPVAAPNATPSPAPAPIPLPRLTSSTDGGLDISLHIPPVNLNVMLPQLHRASAAIFAALGMVEAHAASLEGRPVAFIVAQMRLVPIIEDMIKLAQGCVTSFTNYQTCETNLLPAMERQALDLVGFVAKEAGVLATSVLNATIATKPVALESRQQFTTSASRTIGAVFEKLAMTNGTGEILVEATPFGSVVPGGTSGRHFIIYLPGTQNWSPIRGKSVFDLTSDAQSLVGFTSSAERAAHEALKLAGFGTSPSDKLTIAGYSEGAIVGKEVAKTLGAHQVEGLIAVGAPIDAVHLPEGIRVLNLQHNNDPVPQLDLTPQQDKPNWWNVPLPNTGLLGHSLNSYMQSVANLPLATQHQLSAEVARLNPAGQVVVTGYLAHQG
jgi:hypothetical protein